MLLSWKYPNFFGKVLSSSLLFYCLPTLSFIRLKQTEKSQFVRANSAHDSAECSITQSAVSLLYNESYNEVLSPELKWIKLLRPGTPILITLTLWKPAPAFCTVYLSVNEKALRKTNRSGEKN